MIKLPFALLATAACAIAVPAAAQSGYDPYPNSNSSQAYAGEAGMQNRIGQLETRLQAGIQTGAITTAEARPLRQQIRYLTQLERRYSADGLNQTERQDLQKRFRYTRQRLRAADPNNTQYSRWDRDDSDPYASTGYGNTGYGNSTGYNNAAGRYQQVNEVCRTQSGLKGILGSVFGADRCLRVGERVTATASLGAVPDTYRNEFPNSSQYSYRYIDGNVVQIENRTSVVTGIYNVQYGG